MAGRHARDPGGWWGRNWGWIVLLGLFALTQLLHAHGIYPSTSPFAPR